MTKSNTDNPNKTTAAALDEQLIAGVKKYYAGATTLTLAGTSYTPTTLIAGLQAEIDANNAIIASRAQWKQQVANAKAARVSARKLRTALRDFVLATNGEGSVQMLEDFG